MGEESPAPSQASNVHRRQRRAAGAQPTGVSRTLAGTRVGSSPDLSQLAGEPDGVAQRASERVVVEVGEHVFFGRPVLGEARRPRCERRAGRSRVAAMTARRGTGCSPSRPSSRSAPVVPASQPGNRRHCGGRAARPRSSTHQLGWRTSTATRRCLGNSPRVASSSPRSQRKSGGSCSRKGPSFGPRPAALSTSRCTGSRGSLSRRMCERYRLAFTVTTKSSGVRSRQLLEDRAFRQAVEGVVHLDGGETGGVVLEPAPLRDARRIEALPPVPVLPSRRPELDRHAEDTTDEGPGARRPVRALGEGGARSVAATGSDASSH